MTTVFSTIGRHTAAAGRFLLGNIAAVSAIAIAGLVLASRAFLSDSLYENAVVLGLSGLITLNILKFVLQLRANRPQGNGSVPRMSDRRKLEQSVSLLHATLESTADAILAVDLHGRIVSLNKKLTQMMRIPPSVVSGNDDNVLLRYVCDQVKEPDKFRSRIEELYRDPSTDAFDVVEFKDGRIFERYSHPQIVAGQYAGRVWSFRDVTNAVRTRTALQESRRRAVAILDNMPDMAWLKDREGRFIAVNESFARACGRTASDIIDKTDFDIWPRELAEKYVNDDRRIMAEGHRIQVEEPITDADGGVAWYETIKSPVYDDKGQIIGTTGQARDCSERHRTLHALQESEERYRTLFDASFDAIFIHTDALIDCNERACELTGYGRDELIGRRADEFAPQYQPDGRLSKEVFSSHVETAAGGTPQLFYWQSLRKDGSLMDTEVSVNTVTIGNWHVIISSVRDITARLRAEKALRDSEERHRALLEAIPDLIFLMTKQGEFVDFRVADARLLAVPPDRLKGRTLYETLPTRVAEEAMYNIAKAIQTREPQIFEYTLELPAGCHHFEARIVAYDDDKVLAIVRDITQRKLADLALRDSEARYRMLADHSTDLVIGMNRERNLTYISPSCRSLLGYEPEELIGKLSLEFIHPDDIKGRMKVEGGEETPSGTTYECRLRRKDGVYVWVEATGQEVRDKATGEVTHVVATCRDITSRREVLNALRESEEQFRILAEESPNMIFINVGGKVVYSNRQCEKVMGYTCQEFCDDEFNFLSLAAPEYRAKMVESYQAHLRGEYVAPTEYSLLTKSGERVHMILATQLIRYRNSMAILGVVTDITESRRIQEALQASEERYRLLIERMTDVFYAMTMDGDFLALSPSFEQATGWRIEEWVGRNVSELVHPDDLERALAVHRECVNGQPTRPQEFRVTTRSGQYLVLEVKPSIYLRDGKVVGTMGVARDITERVNTQEQLRKLSKAVEQSPVSVVITDTDGLIEYVNPRFTELTGYSFDEVRGRKPSVLKSGFMAPEVYEDLWRTITSGKAWYGRLQNRKKDGSLYWERASVCGIADDTGRVTHYVAVKEDITERVVRESELRRLSAAMEQSANLVTIMDPAGIIEYVNPKFCVVTGYSADDVIGKPISFVSSAKQDDELTQHLWTTIKSGHLWAGTLLNRKKNGGTFWERRTVSPVLDDYGNIANLVSVGEDITVEMTTQQKLVEADKLAAIGVLAAGVAHEFKNYLGGIIGNASYALEELDTNSESGLPLAKETLSQIVQMGERANDVAMSLLTYSKARPEELVRTNLQTVVTNTISLVSKEMKGRSIELVTYLEEVPEVRISSSKIQQLLLNLLINAEQAITDSGVITISLTSDGQNIRLSVGDTGAGIPSRILARIFDPFFSTKGVWGSDKIAGTGMGLAICRNIAREHDGELSVESIVGAGSTFTLTLPLDSMRSTGAPAPVMTRHKRVIIFSLDKSLLSHYFADACAGGVELIALDDASKFSESAGLKADLIICDARFSGKVELYRTVEICRSRGIPYVMINCGPLEYQLSHLYDHAAANFRALPELSNLLATIRSDSTPVEPD